MIYTLIGIGHFRLYFYRLFEHKVNAKYSTICGADASFDDTASLLTYKSRVSTAISSSTVSGIIVEPVMMSGELIWWYIWINNEWCQPWIANKGGIFHWQQGYANLCQKLRGEKKDAATDDAVDFYIVENGCDKTLAKIEPEQKAASCTAEKCSVELWFDQFGFVVSGTTGTLPAL